VRIVGDLSALDDWWHREDPTREPRFDVFAFPGCAGGLDALDLSSVRLPHETAYYQPIDGRSDKLRADLSATFANPAEKELVYYDAPVDTPFDCGQSSIAPETTAFSFVYLQAGGCTHDLGAGGGTAGYTAHELLHNLGAVPDAAPHICFEHSVCDWYWDVETQFPTGDPITKLVLDYGRDDYYGHSGSWFDVQDSLVARTRRDAAGRAQRRPRRQGPGLGGEQRAGNRLPRRVLDRLGAGDRSPLAGDVGRWVALPRLEWTVHRFWPLWPHRQGRDTGDGDVCARGRIARRLDPRPRHRHERAARNRVPAALLGSLQLRDDGRASPEAARRLAPRPLCLPGLPRRRPPCDRRLPPLSV
jgi:hypothetical protein